MNRHQCILAGVMFLAGAAAAEANPITLVETIEASGVLDGVSFTNALVTITASADNNASVALGEFITVTNAAGVSVVGVGSDAFSDPFAITSDLLHVIIGIEDENYNGLGGSRPFLKLISGASPGYDLSTSLAPVTGTATANLGLVFGTAHGTFEITSLSSSSITASARVTPEPSALALGVVGGLGALGYVVRRRTPRS
jgi:hypothetical protein